MEEDGNGKILGADNKPIENKSEDKKEPASNEPKIVLQIIINSDGSASMQTALLPPMVVFLFEEMKHQMFQNMQNHQNKIVVPPKHTMLNFVRRFKR